MTYTKAESLSFGYLYVFLSRAYKKNLQGGGVRPITFTATASYLPYGMDNEGEPTIAVRYHNTPVLELTSSALEFTGVETEHSKPAVNLYNRFLEEHAPGHHLAFDPRHLALMYGEKPGKMLELEFASGMVDTESGRFIEVNGRYLPNYTDNKEDN